MKRTAKLLLVTALLFSVSLPVAAKSSVVKKLAKEMTKGTLYMRVNAPAVMGRHPYGIYYKPLVEISPEGVNTQGGQGTDIGWWHLSSTTWEVRINDPVEIDELDFDEDEIELEIEGTGPANGKDTSIKFVNINSEEDFKKAFDLAFSTKPLQEEHDWPAEIRDAIASHRLVKGMTKRQAYCITGDPMSFDQSEQDGVKVETWHLVAAYGLPSVIKFTDGALSDTGGVGGSGVNLDD